MALVFGIGGPHGHCRFLSASGSLCLRVSWPLSIKLNKAVLRGSWLLSSSGLRGLTARHYGL